MDRCRNIRAARRLLKWNYPTIHVRDSLLAGLLDKRPSLTGEELVTVAVIAFASVEVGANDPARIDGMLQVAMFVRGLPGFERDSDLARTLNDALAALSGRDPAIRLQ